MNIQAYRTDMGEERTFKVSRIISVNGHSFSSISFFARLANVSSFRNSFVPLQTVWRSSD